MARQFSAPHAPVGTRGHRGSSHGAAAMVLAGVLVIVYGIASGPGGEKVSSAMSTYPCVAQRNDGEAPAAVEKAHPKRDE